MTGSAATGHRGRGLGRVRAFVADYHLDAGTRRATADEKRLIEQALIDYLLAEEWLSSPAHGRVASAVRAMAMLINLLPAIAKPTVRLIEDCLVDLAGRLEHREDANLIMREHLVGLSETIRRLEQRTAPHPD